MDEESPPVDSVLVGRDNGRADCFLRLPQSWTDALWNAPWAWKRGGVVLHLQWSVPGQPTKQREAWVSWGAGSISSEPDVCQLHPSFLNALLLEEDVSGDDQQTKASTNKEEPRIHVTVRRCTRQRIPIAAQVFVTPVSDTDWEILERNAGLLEDTLIGQIHVVAPSQPILAWIGREALVRLRTDSILTRDGDTTSPFALLDQDTEVIVAPRKRERDKEPFVPVDVRVLPAECFHVGNDVGLDTESGVLWLHGSTESSPTLARVFHSSTMDPKEASYATVKYSPTVPNGHVLAGKQERLLVQIEPFDRLRLGIGALPELFPAIKGVTLTPLVYRSGSTTNTDPDYLKQLWIEHTSMRTRGQTALVTSKTSLFSLPNFKSKASSFIVRVQIETLVEGLPYVSLRDVDWSAVDVQVGEPETSSKVTAPVESFLKWTVSYPTLGGADDMLDKLSSSIITKLTLPLLQEHLKLTNMGALLLTGGHGYGKTATVQKVMEMVSKTTEAWAYTSMISCSDLKDQPVDLIHESLREQLVKAAWCSPSLLVLDDLDQLIPAEQENVDSSRVQQLSVILYQLLDHFMSRFLISVLATAQDVASLYKPFASSHAFRERFKLSPCSRKSREKIVKVLVEASGASLSPNFDVEKVAYSTDGYLPHDLNALVQKALHEMTLRSLRQPDRQKRSLINSDFQTAMTGYTPISLKNVNQKTGSDVLWSDVGGLKEVKEVLIQTLEWPTKYAAIFASCPLRLRSGILLYGYPGCGKTMLASAVAKECGLNFISIKGPELLNKYIGASERSVRQVFEQAQAAKPCVLFFDEFDSIAPRRGHDNTGVTDRVVNQLLTQMDGAEGLDGVYVLAATSRPDMIDPALLRPGRLDKALLCSLPNDEERLDILLTASKKLELDPSVDLASYVSQLPGYTGADLQSFLYTAHLGSVLEVMEEKKKSGVKEKNNATEYEFLVLQEGSEKTPPIKRDAIERKLESILSSQERDNTSIDKTEVKPKIQSRHLDQALKDSKASLSLSEKRRFQKIFEAFQNPTPSSLDEEGVGQRVTLG